MIIHFLSLVTLRAANPASQEIWPCFGGPGSSDRSSILAAAAPSPQTPDQARDALRTMSGRWSYAVILRDP